MASEAEHLRMCVRMAVNEVCDCGGNGPGAGCLACEVWHTIRRLGRLNAMLEPSPAQGRGEGDDG